MSLERANVTTANDLAGHRIVASLGIVRGISVRSRSVIGNVMGSFQALFGGQISAYQQLCERTRHDAYETMILHAERQGATGIVGMRYDANEVMAGITEVLCYGTAVMVEKLPS